MSFQAIRAVLDRSEAKGSARLLLLILAEHLNQNTRRCDPSVATRAREGKTSRRTIPRLLAQLKAAGEIEINAGGGRNHCNSYTITVAENPDKDVTVSEANPDTRVTRTIRNQKDISHSADDPAFTAFWSAYPRKVAKPAALKAWRSAKSRPPLADLLAALDRHKGSEQWQAARFVPHPATWINGQRWDDQLPTASEHKPPALRL